MSLMIVDSLSIACATVIIERHLPRSHEIMHQILHKKNDWLASTLRHYGSQPYHFDCNRVSLNKKCVHGRQLLIRP